MAYFVIRTGDGGIDVYGPMTHEMAQARINNGYWGRGVKWLSERPDDYQEMGDYEALIIKGEIVQPRPVEVVTRYELPE